MTNEQFDSFVQDLLNDLKKYEERRRISAEILDKIIEDMQSGLRA